MIRAEQKGLVINPLHVGDRWAWSDRPPTFTAFLEFETDSILILKSIIDMLRHTVQKTLILPRNEWNKRVQI